MNNMTNDPETSINQDSRAVILLQNVLNELADKIEWDSDAQFKAWLRTEIGMTEEEMDAISVPTIPEQNMELE